jgi:alpha-mannosidase
MMTGSRTHSDHPSGSPPFVGHRDYVRRRIGQLVEQMAETVYPECVAPDKLEVAGPVDRISVEQAMKLPYRPASLGESFGPVFATFWFRLKITVPESWQGQRVDLGWLSHSEALVWMDGRALQGLNPGRETAKILESARGGERLTLYIEMACNRLLGPEGLPGYPWPKPGRRSAYWLQICELRRFDPQAWAMYHDLRVLAELEADREPSQTSRASSVSRHVVRPALDTAWAGKLLYDLNHVCNVLDTDNANTWPEAQAVLHDLLSVRNGGVTHELSAIGHAHIDVAWLWPIEETHRKAVRTFSSAVSYMEDYPTYKFACSQAYLYEYIEQNRPDLFERICRKVETNQWVPVGGTYVEMDCNLPSGESLCRQFLYGQRYFESRFGLRCRELWNPDVFGYNGQLPQIMKLAGVDYFLTQKLSWNRFSSPSHHTFYWEGIDGSRVLTHFPPSDTYNGTCDIAELRYHAANYKDADRGTQGYYLFGHGDGGGGPTTEMLETLARTGDLLGVPRAAMRDPGEFFQRLERDARSITTVVGELYFELHRGTCTSQAAMKRGLRKSELLLHDIEFLAVLTGQLCGHPFDKATVDPLWKRLLVNQFHDILPGSSIGEVYRRASEDYAWILDCGNSIRDGLLEQLACRETETAGDSQQPVNTIGFPRREVATAPDGQLAFVETPAMGFGRVVPCEDRVSVDAQQDTITLENNCLRATLSAGGELVSLVHKPTGREALARPGSQLRLHGDHPTQWDAWDIDPSILETGRDCHPAESWRVGREDPLRCEVIFQRQIGRQSRMTQTVRLDAEAGRLEFHCQMDWHERHQLLKVAFPVNIRSTLATYEMPFGMAERPTHANTNADLAQYEVAGHRWSDLSEPGFGVSLLTESKYGYSTHGNVMAVSLLRAPTYPDPEADQGEHTFAYAIAPHADTWREANTVAEAASFNAPLLWTRGPSSAMPKSFFSVDRPELVIDTVKPAEDGNGIVLRLYESTGQRGQAMLHVGSPFGKVVRTNILEDDLENLPAGQEGVPLAYGPYEIICLRLTLD